MEPIPETIVAVEEFGPFSADPDEDLLDVLKERAASVERLVPSLVGLSVASLAEGVTFTLAASDDVPAVLDGLQYLSDGPVSRPRRREPPPSTTVTGSSPRSRGGCSRWGPPTRACTAR